MSNNKREEGDTASGVIPQEVKTIEVEAQEGVTKEEHSDLEEVQDAINNVKAENLAVKAACAAIETEKADLENAIAVKTAKIEELEAKASAPTIHISKDNVMIDQAGEQFKTFLLEGVEGLRTKGSDIQISTDAQGGYALPEELRQEIIKLENERSPIRQVASVVSSSTTDVKQLVSTGGAASGWVGETTSRTQTNTPDLAQRTATFGEVYAKGLVYQHMLEDAFFNTEAWLAEEVARQFAEAEGVAFLSGNGTNKPVGIINGLTLSASADANDNTGVYEVIESTTDGLLGATDAGIIDFLRTVVDATKTGYLPNSKWMMNRTTYGVLVGMKDSDGTPYINRDISEKAVERLFGYEVLINEDMDSAPTSTGSNCVALFGDFARGYQIVDRVGVSMLRDPFTTPGAVSFYTRKRVGSMVLDASALKVVTVSKT